MPNQPDPAQLYRDSGVAEAEAERGRVQAALQAEQARLKELTRLDNQRRARGSAASTATDLEVILDQQAADDRLARDVAASNTKIIELFRELRVSRDRVAELRAALDVQLRPLPLASRQERVGRIAELAMALGDELQADRLAIAEEERLVQAAGLRSLNYEVLLPGIASRLCLTDGVPPYFSELTAEWTRRGWLVGTAADRATARARRLFEQMEQANLDMQRRREAGQRQAEQQRLQTQRSLLASGGLRISRGNGQPGHYSPEEAVRRFDARHSGLPKPKPAPEPKVGGLVPA